MSRLNSPGMLMSKPTNNVYTGLAFISAAVTFVAMVYILLRFHEMGIF